MKLGLLTRKEEDKPKPRWERFLRPKLEQIINEHTRKYYMYKRIDKAIRVITIQ
jgi:hypothetical protein